MLQKISSVLALIALGAVAHADPQITSWFTANSGKYARIYTTTANQTSQTTSSTWSRGSTQTNPAYSGVHEINYSANWIYIRTTGLASHLMGPWYLDSGKTQLFPNYPSNTATVYRIPRTSALGTPPATKTLTSNGPIGFFVNGVAFFDNRDAFSYKNSSATDATPTNGLTGDGIWNRDAYLNEQVSFDSALAHQAGNQYHYHVQPIALRYQLGDHVTYNSTANTYAESGATVSAHSPIIAWAADGYPVYGPYGYSDPTNASSGVRRMVSGYTKRDGTKNTTNLNTTGRTTLPAWAATAQGRSATLTSTQYGPSVNTTYPIGHYLEDNDYLGSLGFTQTTGATVRDFDLDQYNGRQCVTPEFPGGTYAYFSTLDSTNAPAFPYNIGRQFYGNVTGGVTNTTVMNTDTPLTQQFLGGANTPIAINTPSVSGTSVTLTWSAVEGGTYSVDASAASNFSPFTNKASGLVSTGISDSATYTALGTSGTEYGRVNRTALATYDTNGQTAATVSQTTSTSYSLGTTNVAPTLTTIGTLTGAWKNTAYNITYATLFAASNAADANGDTISFQIQAVSSGTLTKNGTAVTAGSTLISTGDTVVWTPATNATGTLAAFTVKAYDGSLTSSTAVAVNVSVAANTPPTLTTINTLTGATEDTAFSITYATLFAASNAADADGNTISFQIQAVSSGTLTKNGTAVTAGSTLISTGDTVVWTPAANATGTLAAFTVEAYDGTTTSSAPVTVNVSVAAVNDPPTLSTISTLTNAVTNTPFTIAYATLLAASNAADVDGDTIQFRIDSVGAGTLTKNGVAVIPGTTTINVGDSLVWTPAANFTGTVAAFTVEAWDGALASGTPVAVNITVSASDPQLSSWYVSQTGKYARIVETDAQLLANTTETTWTRTSGPNTLAQTLPVYAGPQQIDYSASWIYIRTPDLATYTMGPWYNDATRTTLFLNIPKNQGLIVKIPRSSTLGAIPATKTQTPGYTLGGVLQDAIGWYVDGVAVFDPLDGYSYYNGTEVQGGAGQWHRDAYVNEGVTFDMSLAHEQNTGKYHNHANPIGLRYQLGDAVAFNSTTKAYSETLSPAQHSPIIGWMLDGLPVYGPYGYSSALDAGSGVRRMIGGFVKRDGTTAGVDNISTTGSARSLPAWALRLNGNVSAAGPNVSSTYPFLRYIEDWAYLGDLQKSAGANYQQGVDFDLNEYNVRYCVTPEFPNGTYAYFLNISSNGTPQFPYMCNHWFYGTPTGGSVTTISETVTNQFMGGANRPLAITNTATAGTTVTLTWNATEGGTYSVDASPNNSTWTNKATGIAVSNANTGTDSYTALGTTGTEYGRVNRTALASYDTTGTTTATVAQTASTSYALGLNPPTLTSVSNLSGDTESTAYSIAYAALLAASNASDPNGYLISFRVESVVSGTLTKNGVAVTPGSTLLSSGDTWVWTPPTAANGNLVAFTVRAWDGALASSTAVNVTVSVTPAANNAVWSGGAGTGAWGTAGNWQYGVVPDTIDGVSFAGASPFSVDTGTARTVASVAFSGGSGYTIANNTLTLAAGGMITTTNPASGSVTHTISSAVTLGSTATVSADSNATLQISGALTGGGTLTKSGGGTLLFTGTGTAIVGSTTVSAGTLSISSASLAATADVNLASGATLDLNFSGTNTVNRLFLGGVQQPSGTWRSLTSSATHKTSQITGSGLLNVTGLQTFTAWASSNGLSGANAAFTADPNGDGISNGLAFVLGANPLASSTGVLPVETVAGGYLTLGFWRNVDSESVTALTVEYTTDFVTWKTTTVGTSSSTDANGVITTVTPGSTGYDAVTVAIPVGTNKKMYARLKVTQ